MRGLAVAMPASGEHEEVQGDTSAAQALEEGVPLLPKGHGSATKSGRETRTWAEHQQSLSEQGLAGYTKSLCEDEDSTEVVDIAHNGKIMFYDQNSLLTPKTVMHIGISAFTQAPVVATLV